VIAGRTRARAREGDPTVLRLYFVEEAPAPARRSPARNRTGGATVLESRTKPGVDDRIDGDDMRNDDHKRDPARERNARLRDAAARLGIASGWLLLAASAPARGQDRIAETVHNLSAGGPGTIRAQSEQQICIFCHAPHNTNGARPLWNRDMPNTVYQIYSSSTLDATPGQPTGASKLCLSCHDGTIALGSVLSRADRIRMSGGDYIPAGLTNLGTDLSDDHPISFMYTSGLAAADLQLKPPTALPAEVRLDANAQLQCTSCHDPHFNGFGDFLVMANEFSRLCTACHDMNGWSVTTHASSTASVSGIDEANWTYSTVASNACRSCHTSHTAGGRERLLLFAAEEDNCLTCHDGGVARHDIRAEINKLAAHDPRRYEGRHDPTETTLSGGPHVECADCHNPHAASREVRTGTYTPIGATLAKVPGVNQGGARVAEAQYEYEVCFRCHGDNAVDVSDQVLRYAQTSNLRLEFAQSNASYHPVIAPVSTTDTVSLKPGMAFGSMMRCTDCHNNDTGPGSGGAGADGPHGSIHRFLLERNYTVQDETQEGTFEYAMCYKCHQRSSILGDNSFPLHRLHIVDVQSPCSGCHDAHGVSSLVGVGGSDQTHLINFDPAIVSPVAGRVAPIFRDEGRFAGNCTLVCHGSQHFALPYSAGAIP